MTNNIYEQAAYEYGTCHCWYYILGSQVLTPKQMREKVKGSTFQGYKEENITKAASMSEPNRSQTLRKIQQECHEELSQDISRYRVVVRRLSIWRKEHYPLTQWPTSSGDEHLAVSLVHNHLYNDFAHLIWLDELLGQQLDLFAI